MLTSYSVIDLIRSMNGVILDEISLTILPLSEEENHDPVEDVSDVVVAARLLTFFLFTADDILIVMAE